MSEKMKQADYIVILAEHNQWRRGLKPYDEVGSSMPHDPRDLGVAIERVIELLEEKDKLLEMMAAALEFLFKCELNEMTSRNLPHEWTKESGMGVAEQALTTYEAASKTKGE